MIYLIYLLIEDLYRRFGKISVLILNKLLYIVKFVSTMTVLTKPIFFKIINCTSYDLKKDNKSVLNIYIEWN